MPPDVVILSPHLDDAVLSCWHVLAAEPGVRIVNVFTGLPAGGVGEWDRRTGATDSVRRMRERLAEDRAALRELELGAVNVGLLDAQYRDGEEPPAPLDALVALVSPGDRLYVPAALGGHPDHVLARDAGLALGEHGVDVRLYADLPHAAAAGLPAWVLGDTAGRAHNGDWRAVGRASSVELCERVADVHRLDDAAFGRKLAAVHCYATQVPGLLSLAPLESLRVEVTWPS